jgi:hypothetical protein
MQTSSQRILLRGGKSIAQRRWGRLWCLEQAFWSIRSLGWQLVWVGDDCRIQRSDTMCAGGVEGQVLHNAVWSQHGRLCVGHTKRVFWVSRMASEAAWLLLAYTGLSVADAAQRSVAALVAFVG